jgi:hypothetical protein
MTVMDVGHSRLVLDMALAVAAQEEAGSRRVPPGSGAAAARGAEVGRFCQVIQSI